MRVIALLILTLSLCACSGDSVSGDSVEQAVENNVQAMAENSTRNKTLKDKVFGPVRVDGSNRKVYGQSLKAMFEGLSEEDQKRLYASLIAISFGGGPSLMAADRQIKQDYIRNKINGMTFEEILYRGSAEGRMAAGDGA